MFFSFARQVYLKIEQLPLVVFPDLLLYVESIPFCEIDSKHFQVVPVATTPEQSNVLE